MASIRPHKDGWRAFVDYKGVRQSKVFSTKSRATAWARQLEHEIESRLAGHIPDKTFGELLDEYLAKVTITKRSKDWETNKIKFIQSMAIAKVSLTELNVTHFATWRDERTRTVSAGTIRREWNLLHNACNVAINEWKWLRSNPMQGLKKPPPPSPRDRLITDNEINLILYVADYTKDALLDTNTKRVGAIFLFAIETAMRLKEMTRLTWDRVHLSKKYIHVTNDSKTGKRDVALSAEAIRLLKQLEKVKDGDLVFQLNESQVDSLFRKLRSKAALSGFTFHDAKHLACTRLAKKLSPFELAKMVGTRDLKTLMIYFNKSASDIADML